ncbi:MAG: FAD-dependent monooxygenase [bacterium]|nr:FAD-dependent monooxygenase [bacterium]
MTSIKAIIIGGGIGGLSAAFALVQAGIQVALYERATELKPVGAGISLWANAIKALDQLGVGERLRELGMMEGSGGFHIPSGKTLLATDIQAMQKRFGAPTIVIHRADLITILQEQVKGQIFLNKTFSGYQEHEKGITAQFADGTTADADMLICADGIHSVLRKSWFPQSLPVYSGYTAWRGVAPFDHARVGGHWGETLGRGIRFGIAPLPNGQIYWFATQNAPANALKNEKNHQAYLLNLFGGWYDPIPSLIQATPNDAILNNDIYDINPITEWVRGNMALLGDSAHAMTPNMGQGGCMAIEDAVVLGKCLGADKNIGQALLEYQKLRVPRANKVQGMSRLLGKVLSNPNRVVYRARNLAFGLMPASVQMRNLGSIVGFEV